MSNNNSALIFINLWHNPWDCINRNKGDGWPHLPSEITSRLLPLFSISGRAIQNFDSNIPPMLRFGSPRSISSPVTVM
jgi:hypothetical protein